MGMSKKIRVLLAQREITMTELARRLNTSKSNISDKLKRDNFSEKELVAIAEVLDCEFKGVFILKENGKEIDLD